MNHDRALFWMVTMLLIAGIAFLAFVSVLIWPAHAIDTGQYEGVDPATRSWFKSVKSKSGVPCCDMSDGHPTDFKVDEGGIYFVPIAGEWTRVPPEAVITSQGNPNDTAIVWYVAQGQSNGMPHYHVRCFVPIGGV